MKKRRNLIIFFSILIAFVGGVFSYKTFINIDSMVYLSSRNESHRSFVSYTNDKSDNNSKSFDFKKFDGKWSLMQFTSDNDGEIEIIDKTKISKGKFYIVVLDSEYNIIAQKNESSGTGDIKFDAKKGEKYSIRIAGEKASGTFDISVNTNSDIDITYIDFFD